MAREKHKIKTLPHLTGPYRTLPDTTGPYRTIKLIDFAPFAPGHYRALPQRLKRVGLCEIICSVGAGGYVPTSLMVGAAAPQRPGRAVRRNNKRKAVPECSIGWQRN